MLCNPGRAIVSQSKRFPLTWEELGCDLPTWRALLPETRRPEMVRPLDSEDWVIKPAFGRVGEGVAIRGVTPEKEYAESIRAARRAPGDWVAQRRFHIAPVETQDGGAVYPCVGVYVIDGKAAGVYGRISAYARTDHAAQDAAVLLTKEGDE